MGDPGRIKAWQWGTWVVVQVAGIWGAVAAYGSMNHGGYHAGHWAWIVSGPLVVLPLLYGWSLVQGALAHAAFASRQRQMIRPTSAPMCELCHARPRSWNTRLQAWADTCSSCRGPNYFDNDNMVG
jgi:hypothetical protein